MENKIVSTAPSSAPGDTAYQPTGRFESISRIVLWSVAVAGCTSRSSVGEPHDPSYGQVFIAMAGLAIIVCTTLKGYKTGSIELLIFKNFPGWTLSRDDSPHLFWATIWWNIFLIVAFIRYGISVL